MRSFFSVLNSIEAQIDAGEWNTAAAYVRNLDDAARQQKSAFEILSGCLVNTKGGLAAKWAIPGETWGPQHCNVPN